MARIILDGADYDAAMDAFLAEPSGTTCLLAIGAALVCDKYFNGMEGAIESNATSMSICDEAREMSFTLVDPFA